MGSIILSDTPERLVQPVGTPVIAGIDLKYPAKRSNNFRGIPQQVSMFIIKIRLGQQHLGAFRVQFKRPAQVFIHHPVPVFPV